MRWCARCATALPEPYGSCPRCSGTDASGSGFGVPYPPPTPASPRRTPEIPPHTPATSPPSSAEPESRSQPPTAPPARTIPDRPAGPPLRRRRPRPIRRLVRRVFSALFVLALATLAYMISLNWFLPPFTMFQLTDPADGSTIAQPVSLDHVDRDLLAAVLLHEDPELGTRAGPFDIGQFLDRVRIHVGGGDDPSGSTIPQQLVKNLFFTRDQNALRKGLEAMLAFPFNAVVDDRRQLELYVNSAQFAPEVYGICAASWYYFNTPPWDISGDQAIALASLLPTADFARRADGGGLDVSNTEGVVYRAWNRNTWYLPNQLAAVGGWPGITSTIGIDEPASTHADRRNDPDACSTMPPSVRQRLAAENAWWSERFLR